MTETLDARLTSALLARSMSQSDLATAIGASPAAVSAWCSGRKQPGRKNLRAISEALSVEPSWLEYGGELLSDTDLEHERLQYGQDLVWYFQKPPPDRQRVLGNAAEYAFDGNFETLARETGQNTGDERRPGEPTVELRYTVIELAGAELEDFLRVLKFQEELRPHFDAAASTGQKTAGVIRAGLKRLEDSGRLLLLRIEDYHANGLLGPEFDSGRFMAVARNVLDSQKGETAGGSYGLGKSVMWAVSSFGLVLMNSTLAVPEDGRSSYRFLARLELPWRIVGNQPFAGPAWLGLWSEENQCTVSYWENEALAHDLYMARDAGLPGTTFLVVGAYDPSGEVEDLDEIADRLRSSLAINFWPAMVERGSEGPARLTAKVRTQRGRTVLSEHVVDPEEYVPELVDALRRHYDGEVVDELEEPGDVVRRQITIRVPRRTEDPQHEPIEHDAILLVAQAEDRDAEGVDQISYLRGNHMVIRAETVRPLPLGARPFRAVLLAGEAAGDSAAEKHAERFLRAAEPPAHHKWEPTSDVTSHYPEGGRKAIETLLKDVRDAIRAIVGRPSRDLSDGPEALKELLRLVPRPTEAAPRPRVKTVRGQPNHAGAWDVEVTVSVPPKTRGWQFTPVLKFGTESGPSLAVRWSALTALEDCEVEDGALVRVPPGVRSVRFAGTTDPASHPVPAERAKAFIDLRRIHGEETR